MAGEQGTTRIHGLEKNPDNCSLSRAEDHVIKCPPGSLQHPNENMTFVQSLPWYERTCIVANV